METVEEMHLVILVILIHSRDTELFDKFLIDK
jgi:hypothetical protein